MHKLVRNRPVAVTPRKKKGMNSNISFTKIWADDDLLELLIEVNDGHCNFRNEVYAGHDQLASFVEAMDTFKNEIHGGQCQIQFGEFDPKFAAGTCHLLFRFNTLGKLFITAHLQSQFFELDGQKVANEITIHLRADAAQLDNFVRGLAAICDQHSNDAVMITRSH